ncbi:relaxase/mobilization nuclease domain-containing protein [Ruegeria lacuscaerulensis]|uniref:relaxase/mobilization nuclease domain-containing protein n=1 Tax=Ruegeria lacuscaerulensis TaxID=55218 RepID=UPI00147E809D|nr:relaxase/mobilization nuclease domain-containing protein [Ruegeria lacuscaerulensis]
MILQAKERGDGPQLARYLLAMRDNDHVELHEVRGFIGDDLLDAFHETDAIAKGTRCENYLFSMSLNPPQGEQVSTESFENAANEIEQKLGLEGQPRAIVFHEKDGRRHAHCVWSRIDAESMTAINLPFYKRKLIEQSRKLFLEHGWDMPEGFQHWTLRDPLNFNRAEWQQAKRVKLDPRELKALFRNCWESTDSKSALQNALQERGFWLAQGDRKAFVAIDYRGEIYSLSKWSSVRVKDVKARLGDPKDLPSVEQIKTRIGERMTGALSRFVKDMEADARRRSASLEFRRSEMAGRHREERKALKAALEKRWIAETKARAARLPRGMKGIWHRITGRYSEIKRRNERESWDAHRRDQAETDRLILRQLEDRRVLQIEIREHRKQEQEELLDLRADIARYQDLSEEREAEPSRDKDRGRKRNRPHRPRR